MRPTDAMKTLVARRMPGQPQPGTAGPSVLPDLLTGQARKGSLHSSLSPARFPLLVENQKSIPVKDAGSDEMTPKRQ